MQQADAHRLTARADLDVGRVAGGRQEVQGAGVQRVAVGVAAEVQAALRVLEGEAPALPALLHRAATQLSALALAARRRHVGVAAGRFPVLDGGVHVGLEPALTCGGKDTVRTRWMEGDTR